jgi:hypothetical protein
MSGAPFCQITRAPCRSSIHAPGHSATDVSNAARATMKFPANASTSRPAVPPGPRRCVAGSGTQAVAELVSGSLKQPPAERHATFFRAARWIGRSFCTVFHAFRGCALGVSPGSTAWNRAQVLALPVKANLDAGWSRPWTILVKREMRSRVDGSRYDTTEVLDYCAVPRRRAHAKAARFTAMPRFRHR